MAPSFAFYAEFDELLTKMKLAERLSSSVTVSTPQEAAKCVHSGNDIVLLVVRQRAFQQKRILEEAPVAAPVKVSEPNDNVIYVKPDAIFGIGLSIFIFFVAYVGVMCLFNTNTPLVTPKKPFKFGREM